MLSPLARDAAQANLSAARNPALSSFFAGIIAQEADRACGKSSASRKKRGIFTEGAAAYECKTMRCPQNLKRPIEPSHVFGKDVQAVHVNLRLYSAAYFHHAFVRARNIGSAACTLGDKAVFVGKAAFILKLMLLACP